MSAPGAGWRAGWGMALRVAWRDVRRHKARSALVLALIALPVLLVSSGAIVVMTADVRGAERIGRELGDVAQAQIWSEGTEQVLQLPDPREGVNFVGGDGSSRKLPGATELAALLGDDRPVQQLLSSSSTVLLPDGAPSLVDVREGEWSDPLLAGLVEVVDGRLPGAPDEVVVTEELLAAGFDIGSAFPVSGVEPAPSVVGVVRDATDVNNTIAYGPPGSLLAADAPERDQWWGTTWLVGGDPVTWDEVLELNDEKFVVFSRAVVTDPPPDSEVPYKEDEGMYSSSAEQVEYMAVVAMIITMVLLEVVLLAGPAFAVMARHHTRTLALVAASGGTPRQARRVILAAGVVLGFVATLAGLVLSVPVAAAVMPWAQGLMWERFGPFDVPWLVLLVVGAFGLASALLAAVVPAWLTSRQDVVAALAGRRSDGAPKLQVPVIGVLVLGLGVTGAVIGAQRQQDLGPVLMSASAVVTMIGMILVVPALVGLVARSARRLPLPMRYATRDAARHRTRTVPAIAAVAATVAGVVALGISVASDELENQETYMPMTALGTGLVTFDTELMEPGDEPPWDEIESAATTALPSAEVVRVRGAEEVYGHQSNSYWMIRNDRGRDLHLLESYGSSFGSSILVQDAPSDMTLSAAEREEIAAVLATGKAVVLGNREPRRAFEEVILVHRQWEGGEDRVVDRVTMPAEVVRVAGSPWAQVIVPTSLESRFADGAVKPIGLAVTSQLDAADERTLAGAVRDVSARAHLQVERGFQRDADVVVLIWVLGVVGALLMLAGTLTATFLSLADAKPDLATVSAVGGSPRTRRSVAASYALMIASVGAVLGALVGFVPGLALSRSMTVTDYGFAPTGPYLDVPWVLIGSLVVALPLFSAAVVWLFSRSRLPMVARID
ncbi:FtsX-like permease family protein [Nocardioides sp. Y6]|uniref:FtsX-like permease family protein n=1 Tax=Nocardioides malaquae TaxID=2773426 RepID=A0ABR9RSR3_9ACTN|nr:ABC transporter permease [Nocardioides malaquae]MBE7324623.1 FtsX-like permease family protein [Nocardioides malaquae]